MSAALSREFAWFNQTDISNRMELRELEALQREIIDAADYDSLPAWVKEKLKDGELELAERRAGKRRWQA